MPRGQRTEEILRAELPPSLPLMALRSTIVYPLGTIAVQMGAPENLALLRAHEEAGLVVALVVAASDADEVIDPSGFVGRVGVAARVHERINLPGDTIQITLQGLRRITIEAIEQVSPFAVARVQGVKEAPVDAAELVGELPEHGRDACVVGDVQRADRDAHARVTPDDLAAQLLELVEPARAQREVASTRGELERHASPQPRARTRDQDVPAHRRTCLRRAATTP